MKKGIYSITFCDEKRIMGFVWEEMAVCNERCSSAEASATLGPGLS